MLQGNSANADYWIDCNFLSVYMLRAVFGVWISICVTITAASLRAVYRSYIRCKLYSNSNGVSIWRISPPSTLPEAYEMRGLLVRYLLHKEFIYPLASSACIAAAIVGACSTAIANFAVQTNTVRRYAIVNGDLASNNFDYIYNHVVAVNARIQALNKANAPLDELFDFAPDDNSNWVYVAEEWNNTWRGNCTYLTHEGVELVLKSTNSSNFQDEVPALGAWLPQWVMANSSQQGTSYISTRMPAAVGNVTRRFGDEFILYAFGNYSAAISSAKFSFANVLIPNATLSSQDKYLETAAKSDVHVAECTLHKTAQEGMDRAQGEAQGYKTFKAFADNIVAVNPLINPSVKVHLIKNSRSITAQLRKHPSTGSPSCSLLRRRCSAPGRPTCPLRTHRPLIQSNDISLSLCRVSKSGFQLSLQLRLCS
jgi:hypothetical protein